LTLTRKQGGEKMSRIIKVELHEFQFDAKNLGAAGGVESGRWAARKARRRD
jgi:hypothetical protein